MELLIVNNNKFLERKKKNNNNNIIIITKCFWKRKRRNAINNHDLWFMVYGSFFDFIFIYNDYWYGNGLRAPTGAFFYNKNWILLKFFEKEKNDILYVYGKGIYNNNNNTVRAALTVPDAQNFEKEEENGFYGLLNLHLFHPF